MGFPFTANSPGPRPTKNPGHEAGVSAGLSRADRQPKTLRRRRMIAPTPPKPMIIRAQVAGSGTPPWPPPPQLGGGLAPRHGSGGPQSAVQPSGPKASFAATA